MNIVNFKVEELIPYINNPRNNNDAVDKVAASIKEFGFKVPIIINKDNVIVTGHTRLKAAKKLGIEEVPCIIADDLTDAQIKAFRIADNKVSEYAEWDEDLLKVELEQLEEMDFDLDELNIDYSDFDLDIGEDIEEIEPEEVEVPEAPEEPKAKLGDIYQLGNHRLMCGDSTSEEDVAKLMNGVKADMVFTDPPYGINIDNSNGKILGDGDLSVFNNSLKTINEFAKEDAHLYIYFGVQFIKECIEELKKYFKQTNILVQRITHENKPSPKGYFKNNYEMCYFSNRKDKDFNYGLYDVSETTLEDKRYNGDGKLNAYKALTEIKATEHNLKAIHPTQKL